MTDPGPHTRKYERETKEYEESSRYVFPKYWINIDEECRCFEEYREEEERDNKRCDDDIGTPSVLSCETASEDDRQKRKNARREDREDTCKERYKYDNCHKKIKNKAWEWSRYAPTGREIHWPYNRHWVICVVVSRDEVGASEPSLVIRLMVNNWWSHRSHLKRAHLPWRERSASQDDIHCRVPEILQMILGSHLIERRSYFGVLFCLTL